MRKRRPLFNLGAAVQDMLRELRNANPGLGEAEFARIAEEARRAIQEAPPPALAFIGETGVGKSSTINALFNAGQPVSHVRAMTQDSTEIRLAAQTLEGKQGLLTVFDMPGISESVSKHAQHSATYERVLTSVDVAVWVLDASDRAIQPVQEFLSESLRPLAPHLLNRLVFGLNKVDHVFPGETAWHPIANVPAPQQLANIAGRVDDVTEKIREVLPNWRGEVVGYSASRRYNLTGLFAAAVDAVPRSRRWVLASRKSLADFLELVAPEYRPSVTDPSPAKPVPTNLAERIAAMSPREYRKLVGDKAALLRWMEQS